MRLLFTSDRDSGAFAMRGRQLAAARPAWRALAAPSPEDVEAADAVVAVKRAAPETLAGARAAGKPVIYDALDFWPQPKSFWKPRSRAQRLRTAAEARALFRAHFDAYAPDLILCATQAMADDLAPLGRPTAVLRHHADPRLPDPDAYLRPEGRKRLLYFGNGAFLREWEGAVARAARANDAEFVTLDSRGGGYADPPPADAMIAVRGGRDGCWISRAWKSNVKAATAAALGLPLVAWPEAAYRETAPEAHWFEDEAGLSDAIGRALAPQARPVAERFTVERAASDIEQLVGPLL